MTVSFAREEIPELFLRLEKVLEMPASSSWDEYRERFIERWGRKTGQERWEIQDIDLPAGQQQKIYEIVSAFGLLSAWQPRHEFYDYAILPGAILPTMKVRLDWLITLWEQGVHFRQLIILTGQRPLMERVDRVSEVIGDLQPDQQPLHETEAARLLVHTTTLPKGMERVRKLFFDSHRIWNNQRWERPHTGSNVEAWMKSMPQPGSVLLISSQPSAHYQNAVFKSLLPYAFTVETSTPAPASNLPLPLLLDAVATWLRHSVSPPL